MSSTQPQASSIVFEPRSGETPLALGLISLSLAIAILLAFLTYSVGRAISAALIGSGSASETP